MAKSRFRIAAAVWMLVCSMLVSCSKQTIGQYVIPETMEQVSAGNVAQNSRFAMDWDDTAGCVMFRDLSTGHVWSTIPYEFYKSGDFNIDLLSALQIEYYNPENAAVELAYSFDCVDYGQASSQASGNSLRITYYFKEQEITVTVGFTLKEDSFEVSLNSNDIVESGLTRLISVSLTPYLCSAQNVDDKTSYLFVPAGSGALMYTANDAAGNGRSYSGEVYGKDLSRFIMDHPGEEEPVRLPVFGCREKDYALCGIITSSEGAANIKAVAGNRRDNYSAIYASFYVRNFANIEWNSGSHNGMDMYQDAILFDDDLQKDQVFSVRYYPLYGEDAGYAGMAECYRNYLTGKGLLKDSGREQEYYNLTLIGGSQKKEFIAGIPYKRLVPLTTFDQAKAIVSELVSITGWSPQVVLRGFGQSGEDIGKIGGGFSFGGSLGSAGSQKALEQYCRDNGIPIFTDFDLLRFTSSGVGFSLIYDTAFATNTEKVSYLPLKRNIRVDDTSKSPVYLLKRAKLEKAISKLVKFSKNRISGISLSTFGSLAYSDSQDIEYTLKGRWDNQFRKALDDIRAAGHAVVVRAANDYAAGLADGVYDAPLQNGDYSGFDETVPFYEMVYRGFVPLYSAAVNLAIDSESMLLRAVEAGVSPSFTLCGSLDISLADSSESFYYGTAYDSNKELVKQAVSRVSNYLDKIRGARITFHAIIKNGLTKTVFDNGVTVIVNHTDSDMALENGQIIKARSFVY